MFEDCEKVNDFSMWLIRIVRPRYTQIVISIEIPIDLKMLMVEELTGWLKAIEERYELNNDTGGINSKLLFTEDAYIKIRENSARALLVARKRATMVVTTVTVASSVAVSRAQ